LQAKEHVSDCNKNVINKGATFYPEASVVNLKKDPAKIIIGEGTHIRGELLVFPYGGEIKIGMNCYVGKDTMIWSGESIHIGDNVMIAHHVNIIDFAHETASIDRAEGFRNLIAKGHPLEKGKIPTKKIYIEDYVAIYSGAHIIMGVTIGKGSVISAGCVVLSDVPAFSLVSGNPGKVVWKIKPD
jgi:acetyltransferase-like isoleucine patch superfamily enzyme